MKCLICGSFNKGNHRYLEALLAGSKDIELYLAYEPSAKASSFEENMLEDIFEIPFGNSLHIFRTGLSKIRFQSPMVWILPENDFDIIHSHNVIVLSDSPTVVSFEFPNMFDFVRGHYDKSIWHDPKIFEITDSISKRILGRFFSDISCILPWSKMAANWLRKTVPTLGNKTKVVYPGIVTGPDLPAKEHNHEVTRILFVGRAFLKKGGLHLLHAFKDIKDEDAELWLVTKLPNYLKEEIRKDARIRYFGLLPSRILNEQIYPEADIFCMPTVGDSFGMVYLEAMSHGLPVVGTTYGAVPEIIKDNVNGFLVPPRDERVLEDRICELVMDPSLREKMGLAAKKDFNQRFHYRILQKKMHELYKRFV